MHHQVVHWNVQVLICLQFILLEENQNYMGSYQPIPTFKSGLQSQTQHQSAAAGTINIPSSVYYFKDWLPRSHQADPMAGCRGTGDAIKKNKRPTHSNFNRFAHWTSNEKLLWPSLHTLGFQYLGFGSCGAHLYASRPLPVQLKTVLEGNKSLKACEWLEQRVPGSLQRQRVHAWLWAGVGWLHWSLRHVSCWQ